MNEILKKLMLNLVKAKNPAVRAGAYDKIYEHVRQREQDAWKAARQLYNGYANTGYEFHSFDDWEESKIGQTIVGFPTYEIKK